MMMTFRPEAYVDVDVLNRLVETKIGKERILMRRTHKVMVAYTTFKIMMQSLTVRFMMTMISLLQICAAYMTGDAIILRTVKILTTILVAIMKNPPIIVANTMTTILYQQRHVVFVKTELLVTSVRMKNRLKLIVNQYMRVLLK